MMRNPSSGRACGRRKLQTSLPLRTPSTKWLSRRLGWALAFIRQVFALPPTRMNLLPQPSVAGEIEVNLPGWARVLIVTASNATWMVEMTLPIVAIHPKRRALSVRTVRRCETEIDGLKILGTLATAAAEQPKDARTGGDKAGVKEEEERQVIARRKQHSNQLSKGSSKSLVISSCPSSSSRADSICTRRSPWFKR